jgi:hypothetical protein
MLVLASLMMTRPRYPFISRVGSVAYVAVTYHEAGENLPRSVDGNDASWTRIDAAEGAIFSLISTADMERDLHEVGLHITATRTKPRTSWASPGRPPAR